MKKICSLFLMLILSFTVCATGCGETGVCQHDWIDATCTSPKTCMICGITVGSEAPHSFEDATCTSPKMCKVCGMTIGIVKAHNFKDATCTSPKVCNDCGMTSGTAKAHDYSSASCDKPKTCKNCGATQGVTLSHNYTCSIQVQATQTSKGVKRYDCNNCDYYYTEKYELEKYSSTEVYNLAKKSVGEIVTYDKSGDALSLGTTFVISNNGKFLTNYHVIEGASSAKITIDSKEYKVQSILAYDKDIDLAVLKVSTSNLIPVTMQTKYVVGGMRVYAVGSSEGYTLSFSSGVVASPSRVFDGVEYIQHEAAISHGNSGGPLYNEYGEVIGINTSSDISGQNLNFAISCKEVDNLNYNKTYSFEDLFGGNSSEDTKPVTNTFSALKNYAISYGEYDSIDKDYTLKVKSFVNNGYTYVFNLYYHTSENTIEFGLFSSKSTYGNMVFLEIDEIDGVYSWTWIDSSSNYMYGPIYASTWTSKSLLAITYYSFSSSIVSTARELASTMISLMILYIDTEFTSIGVDANDLGFTYF